MINHIEIYVSNLQKSLVMWEWFLNELGYEKFQKWEQGESYKLGEFYIVFVQAEEKFLKDGYHRKRIGLNHLAFKANSKEQIDKISKELKKQKIKILYEEKHPYAGGENHYAVYFEDYDRIKVELCYSS
ncbi:MAG: VOC family protein [Defluviitaleaceae bacterium]|nr:VOC family protein [Defluviitaleaceae bacterium]